MRPSCEARFGKMLSVSSRCGRRDSKRCSEFAQLQPASFSEEAEDGAVSFRGEHT